MAIKAICVACGKPKKNPLLQCQSCQFKPETEYQIARALVFSQKSNIGGMEVGRDAEALKSLSAQISAGRPHEFDPGEVERAVTAWRQEQAEMIRAAEHRRKTRRMIYLVLAIIAILALVVAATILLPTGD